MNLMYFFNITVQNRTVFKKKLTKTLQTLQNKLFFLKKKKNRTNRTFWPPCIYIESNWHSPLESTSVLFPRRSHEGVCIVLPCRHRSWLPVNPTTWSLNLYCPSYSDWQGFKRNLNWIDLQFHIYFITSSHQILCNILVLLLFTNISFPV